VSGNVSKIGEKSEAVVREGSEDDDEG